MNKKAKLLIVDDVPSNIYLFTSILKDKYAIIAATNGEKALKLARKFPQPDMILLDIVMPEMDGYEVCKKLKADPETSHIPVIFVTSLNSIEDQDKGLAIGGVEYITKPISKDIAIHRIETHLNLNKLKEVKIDTKKKEIVSVTLDVSNSQKHILVVDDAPQNIQVMVEILKENYIVSVATSGEKAIDMLKNGLEPDLILLDIIMPEMDGYEVCTILKNNISYKNIPIIFVTILEHEKDIVKGLELGAVDYVVKPIEPKVLKARVDTHLKLKEFQDSLLEDIKMKDEILIEQSKFAMLGEMFENITHQWIQPLSVITMSVGNLKLQKEIGEIDEKTLVNSLNNIDNTTKLLSHTIDDFRDFINFDQHSKVFYLKIAIEKPLNLLKKKLEKSNIKVTSSVEEIYLVKGHENYLVQILMNLLTNTIDAFNINKPDHKIITIDTIIENEDTIILTICDTAGGIEEEKVDAIFDKYYTTKKNIGGTGLGLYMSKMIVETKLNGKITVENKDNGACFNISLPLN